MPNTSKLLLNAIKTQGLSLSWGIGTHSSLNKVLLIFIIVVGVIAITAAVFFGMAFLLVGLLTNQFLEQGDGRPDRPFFVGGTEFEDINTIKSEECLDLVETINTMNPGDQRVDLYKIWLEDCIVPEPALPTIP